jgi:putative transposase
VFEAVDEALQCCGTQEIFNTDQGSAFTGEEFARRLQGVGVRISMDGTGRCLDNVFMSGGGAA